MFGAEANVGVRGKMVDLIRAGEGRLQGVKLKQIDFDEF